MPRFNEYGEIVDELEDSGDSQEGKKISPPHQVQGRSPYVQGPNPYAQGNPSPYTPPTYQTPPASRSSSPIIIFSALFGLVGIGALIVTLVLLLSPDSSSPSTAGSPGEVLVVTATPQDDPTDEPDEEAVPVVSTSPPEPTIAPTSPPEPTNPPAPTSLPEPTIAPTNRPAPTNPPPPTNPPASPAFPAQEVTNILQSAGGSFGAIVYDETDERIIYEYNADSTFYAASLIKLPIAFTVYHLAWQGQLDLQDRLTMQQSDIVPGTGTIQYDGAGSTYTLEDLCRRMIVDSDNTASNMVLDYVGYETVNEVMYQMGATRTIVERRFFDDAARLAGRDIRTSPQDMMEFLRVLQDEPGTYPLLAAMSANTDLAKIPALLPGNAESMNKTGVLPPPDGLEHDMAIVRTPGGRQYIIVIMSTGLYDNQAAINAIAQASRRVFDYEQEMGR